MISLKTTLIWIYSPFNCGIIQTKIENIMQIWQNAGGGGVAHHIRQTWIKYKLFIDEWKNVLFKIYICCLKCSSLIWFRSKLDDLVKTVLSKFAHHTRASTFRHLGIFFFDDTIKPYVTVLESTSNHNHFWLRFSLTNWQLDKIIVIQLTN